MQIIKNKRHWICYPENRTEYNELVEWCRKKFGRSHWNIAQSNWSARHINAEEATTARYYRVVEIYNRDIAIHVQLTWE